MNELSRRSFLRYVGAGMAAASSAHLLGPLASAAPGVSTWVNPDGSPAWRPVGYPIPLPGDAAPANDATRLATFEVKDELLLPEGFRFDILAQWGDRFGGAGHEIDFGYAADYTGLIPVKDRPGEYWLIVNHEYISARPFLQSYTAVRGRELVPYSGKADAASTRGRLAQVRLEGIYNIGDPEYARNISPAFLEGARRLCAAALAELGVSILHVRQEANGRFAVIKDSPHHRRISTTGTYNIAAEKPIRATGPAADIVSWAPAHSATARAR